MSLVVLPVTPFAQNCSVLGCTATSRAAVVDPGGDLDAIDEVLRAHSLVLEKVLVTHGHLDHCGQAAEFADRHAVPIEGPHREDAFWIEQLPAQGARHGFPVLRAFEPARWLDDGDAVTVGALAFEVLHCPGHTPGHVVFFQRETRLAIVGDVLFKGSVGRTDFPRGDAATLVSSITAKLWPLGDDVAFVPGHGPMSTFGDERRSNPYVGDRAVATSSRRFP
ncbi:MAG: MBL fold metallo-hydrolase [Lautropia sp.]